MDLEKYEHVYLLPLELSKGNEGVPKEDPSHLRPTFPALLEMERLSQRPRNKVRKGLNAFRDYLRYRCRWKKPRSYSS